MKDEQEILEEEAIRLSSPRIFEGEWKGEALPGFEAVTIRLDARLNSDLNWQAQRDLAKQARDAGLWILWDIQLGLFNELHHPLTNQMQFLSFTLALEHFRDTLWKEFKHSVGLSLYRGTANFSSQFHWDTHQEQNLKEWLAVKEVHSRTAESWHTTLFCRDVYVEYLSLLASRIPDQLPVFLFLDISPFADVPLTQLQVLNPERFERFALALQGSTLPLQCIGWQRPTSQGYYGFQRVTLPTERRSSVGLCVPSMSHVHADHYQGLEEALTKLQLQDIPFRLIPENQLTSQWDGLDYLIFTPQGLDGQGKRKLQGFCAAGGITVSATNTLIGLAHEITLEAFFCKIYS